MATLSVRLPDALLQEVDRQAVRLGIPRASYVRQALERMKAEVERQRLTERLQSASGRVRAESMAVNAEFDAVEGAP